MKASGGHKQETATAPHTHHSTITDSLPLTITLPLTLYHPASQAGRLQPTHLLLPKILPVCSSLSVFHGLLNSTTLLLSILISWSPLESGRGKMVRCRAEEGSESVKETVSSVQHLGLSVSVNLRMYMCQMGVPL